MVIESEKQRKPDNAGEHSKNEGLNFCEGRQGERSHRVPYDAPSYPSHNKASCGAEYHNATSTNGEETLERKRRLQVAQF